ncbi:MAG: sigma-70 family RNA polymerase sigma factor [Bacteroidetes bacterium]|nr:sigma-70 family RNA polymerase sigma factor [Bacteroidota bacterium]
MNKPKKPVTNEVILKEWREIQKAQSDPAFFRPLYDRYYENIFLFIFKRTADESLTADISSQVFLKALQRLPKYTFKGVPFSAFLYRIASNEVAQHFREVSKNRVISIEEIPLGHLMDEIHEEGDDPHRSVLLSTINQLKKEEVHLIEMRYFEQRPFKEIADILCITESNAKMKTYRILKRMKKMINI